MSNTVASFFGLSQKVGFYVGVEFELENIYEIDYDKIPNINVTEDNSLRNNGREFVTPPITVDQAIKYHHTILHDAVKFNDDPCTDRCSTHVHVNMRDHTLDQVKQFLRLYALVEPIFFQHVNKDRQNNIYCVPLSSTGMLHQVFKGSFDSITEKWHKYCALNAKRLGPWDGMDALGTVEFRHFQATKDTAQFSTWLNMIQGLYMFNKQNTFDSMLMSPSNLYRLANTVSPVPLSMEKINELMEETIINDMLMVVGPDKNMLTQRLQEKETA